MSFGISRSTKGGVQHFYSGMTRSENRNSVYKVLTCYTPTHATISHDTISLVNSPTNPKCVVATNTNLAVMPAGAIIDMIEYIGINSFKTQGDFSIGLGQLNHTILLPLIEDGNQEIANEKVGGCRQFLAASEDGRNPKTITVYPSNVNVTLETAITSGNMRVDIYYHVKQ